MKLPFPIQHVGIYGVGLLGGSLGLALKQIHPGLRITGIGRSTEKLQAAVDRQAIDDFCCNPDALPDEVFDLLILCTPVQMIAAHLQSVLHAVKPRAPITDVGSTKSQLVHACEQAVGNRNPFIGSHPMAGSHQSGIEAASPHLFHDKVCVLTKTEHSHPDILLQLESFWQALGMHTRVLSPEMHDTLTARSSHLPHIMAAVLCKVAEPYGQELIQLVGDGFRDTTRIAAGDPTLWLNICLENHAELVQSIQETRQWMDQLMAWLENHDQDQLYAFFQQAQTWKQQSETTKQKHAAGTP